MATHLEGTVNAALAIAVTHNGWNPAQGSPAARDLANSETGPGGPWGSVPADTARTHACLTLFAAIDQLDGPAFYAEHLLYTEKYLQRCHRMMVTETEEP